MLFIIATVITTVPFFYFYATFFLKWVEQRSELVSIYDPLLARIPTMDTSNVIMALSLSTLAFIYIDCTRHRLMVCAWTMFFTLIVRSIFLIVCPLRVHPYHIVLNDRFIEIITGHRASAAKPFVNDLFMSGHCSWHMVVSCVFPSHQILKHVLFVILSACLLLCKAHYTIDILVVPFVVPTVYRFTVVFITTLERFL